MAVTIKKIAAELGISAATVSLALSGKAGVSEKTRLRIQEKAREMGYPLKEQQSVPKMRSPYLTLVIYKRIGTVVSFHPFFRELIHVISEEVKTCGYQLTTTYFYQNEDKEEQIRSIASLGSEGVILLATEMQSEDMAPFEGLHLPLVILDNHFPMESYDTVMIDNHDAFYRAVHALHSMGHRRIGFLGMKEEIRNWEERGQAYVEAVRSLYSEEEWRTKRGQILVFLRFSRLDPEVVKQEIADYLDKGNVLPTAFVANSDALALECMNAFKQRGLRIPDDVSVMGIDDLKEGWESDPPLTTIHVSQKEMAKAAVDRLLNRIANPEDMVTYRVCLSGTLLWRGSVKRRETEGTRKGPRK